MPVAVHGGTVSFKYDPFGGRIQKAFTQGSTTATTNFLYDGDNDIEEVKASGSILARYNSNFCCMLLYLLPGIGSKV